MSPERTFMTVTWEAILGVVAILSTMIGGVGWLFKLEGRVNTHEEWRKDHEVKHNELREDVTHMRTRLDDIYDKLVERE